MADETTQADAAALVAMTVADLAQHLDGVDLATLLAAKELEQAAPSPRKGALAALDAAIEGHPELSASAAEAADAADAAPSTPVADAPMQDATVDQPAEPAPVEAPAAEPAPATDAPAADIPAMTGVPEATAAEPLADAPTNPEAVSAAPPRPHDSLVSALELRWIELKDFARPLVGEVEGELGELLTFVRSKL